MAKFELRFLDSGDIGNYLSVERIEDGTENFIEIKLVCEDSFSCEEDDNIAGKVISSVWLDKSTAIKLSKTIRTEINKITEREVKNG